MTFVGGVDSSTQACKVVVVDTDSGSVARSGRAPHPDGTEVDPEAWWQALQAAGDGLLDGVSAISVAGQQHGMVALDGRGEVVRPALLWNDTRSAGDARDLVAELGAQSWADAVGSVPVASFTVTKLRWLARNEPGSADRTQSVLLPHDWLTWRLLDRPEVPATDRGDASGTGYWSPRTGDYRPDLVEAAFGRELRLPRVLSPADIAGRTSDGMVVAAGTGDNMGAALGLGLAPSEVAISIGTSGVVSALHGDPVSDPTGYVTGFCDATGRFLPLACTLNAARVLTAAAAMLDVDLAELGRLALAAAPGAGGLTLLPYLDGERTPNLPSATGALLGLTRTNTEPQNLARAAVEGLLCSLADGLDALRAAGIEFDRGLLLGGGSRSAAVAALAPDILGLTVVRPTPDEYVALGAARQAAWALSGSKEPPAWPREAGEEIRHRYGRHRRELHGV